MNYRNIFASDALVIFSIVVGVIVLFLSVMSLCISGWHTDTKMLSPDCAQVTTYYVPRFPGPNEHESVKYIGDCNLNSRAK